MTEGWLQRSGQAWKTRGALLAGWMGMVFAFLPFVLAGVIHRRLPGWVVVLALLGLALLIANSVLPMLVRCGVCSVQLETSLAARALPSSRRLQWVESIQTCPVCGDDGRASLDSRTAWHARGVAAERPYWSSVRIILGIIAAILMVAGGVFVGGRYRVR